MSRGDDHAACRELISGRLDGTLSAAESAQLSVHLAACGRCRAAEAAYRAQRRQLRGLRAAPPPRDLWARTSAALDREVARQGGYVEPGRQRRGLLAGGAAVASVAALGVSLGLLAPQVVPVGTPRATIGATLAAEVALRPTPFGVPSEALAFVGAGAEGLLVYRTRVDHVCPAAAIDCIDYEPSRPTVVNLGDDLTPSNVALSPNGGRLAIEGRDGGGDDVFAVVLMPADELVREPATSTPTPAGAPSGPPVARVTPVPPTATARAATPATEPVETTTAATLPAESLPAEASPATTFRADASPSPPAASEPPAEAEPIPVEETPAAASAPPAAASAPADESPASEPSPPAAASPTVVLDSTAATGQPPLATAATAEEVVAILQDVRSVGAPAAWSADGSMLAFSAMPADRSHGPDVYVWRAGDERAQPLTGDHGSYFASWAGSLLVVSRVEGAPSEEATPAAGDAGHDPEPRVTTVVIDPASGEERTVRGGEALWLPQVNPAATTLVGWHGSLAWSDYEVTPLRGALYAADWASIDPFAPTGVTGDPSTALTLIAVEPGRDPASRPVQEWQIRWSDDGRVLGYWIADVPGATWGQLSVIAVDPATGALLHDAPLLRPSLARRAFSLGHNRVAWVAPADEDPDGELRIRTWGPDGFGVLRLRPQLRGVTPAS